MSWIRVVINYDDLEVDIDKRINPFATKAEVRNELEVIVARAKEAAGITEEEF